LDALPPSYDPFDEAWRDTPDAESPTQPPAEADQEISATVLTPDAGAEPNPFTTGPSAPPTPDLLAVLQQATMGRYVIESELGRGGMAAVFLAHERLANRHVAIKVMSPVLFRGSDTVERFRLEAMTTASLSHPGIVPIYLVEESGGLLYFVMKHVDGPSLEALIAEEGPLPFNAVERVIRGVGDALSYAHSEGVIHRDIKPGNIMLDGRGRPVVTDFGIAKVAEQQTLTMTGRTIGTPTYMSPEQCRGGSLTGASDQYSLGIVLYEMLAGRVPFRADSQWALLYKHMNDPPPHIGEERPDCPQVLWDIIRRMLAKRAEDRWPSFEDAIAYLGAGPSTPVGAPEAVTDATGGLSAQPDEPPEQRGPASVRATMRAGGGAAQAGAGTAPDPSTVEPQEAAVESDDPAVQPEGIEAGEPTGEPGGGEAATQTKEPVAVEAGDMAAEPERGGVGAVSLGHGRAAVDPGTAGEAAAPGVSWPRVSRRAAALAGGAALAIVLVFFGGRFALQSLSSGDGGVEVTGAPEQAEDPPPLQPITASPTVTSLALTPESVDLTVGQEVTLVPRAEDAEGGTVSGAAVRFTSSDPAVAAVTDDGLMRAVSPGSATVTAMAGDVASTSLVRVTAAPAPTPDRVAEVWISEDSLTLEAGLSQSLRSEARNASGGVLAGQQVEWLSADSDVASVTGEGDGATVLGASAGRTRIFARVGGVERSIPVRVTPEPVASVGLTPPALTLQEGESSAIRATIRGVRTAALDRRAAWESSTPAVAAVDAAGVVVALAPGEARITASAGGRTASMSVTVESAAPVPSLTDLVTTLELLDDDVGLGQTVGLTALDPGGASWCAVAVISHGGEDGTSVRITGSFDPGNGGPQSVTLSAPFDQVSLSPGDYRATARLVTSRVEVWAASCGALPPDGAPLGAGEATICLSKLGSGGWRDRPNDCR
jgi:serine/threonine-protein kinase